MAFSDESTFQTVNQGRQRVYRRVDESPHRADMITTAVKHPVKVMVWGIISTKGPGRLHIVDGMMNSVQYCHVIDTRVIPQLHDWFGTLVDCQFQQDKAPCHTSRMSTQALNMAGVRVLQWPGNSPDLNPIENVWGYLKRKISENPPQNRNELIARLIRLWFHDQDIHNMCVNSIHSMPKRLADVIKARGGFTKY